MEEESDNKAYYNASFCFVIPVNTMKTAGIRISGESESKFGG